MVDKFCDYLTYKIRLENPEIDDDRNNRLWTSFNNRGNT